MPTLGALLIVLQLATLGGGMAHSEVQAEDTGVHRHAALAGEALPALGVVETALPVPVPARTAGAPSTHGPNARVEYRPPQWWGGSNPSGARTTAPTDVLRL